MAQMNEQELKAVVEAEVRQSIGGTMGGKLSEQRRRAEYYYFGIAKDDLAPPEIDGRSTFVDTTIRNQIEWMVPSLMRTFCSGENVVEFTPTKKGDEDAAKLATDYINHIFYKKNDGYSVIQTAIRDALLQKAGIIKVWWDNKEEESREDYRALSDIDLALLLKDDEIEPIEQKAYPDEEDAEQRQQALEQLTQQLQSAMQGVQLGDPQAQQIQAQIEQIQSTPQKMLYDVSFKRTKKAGKICIENVPPEEFLISRKSKKISDGFMKGHRVRRSISDLRAMGYDNVDQIGSDEQQAEYSMERVERVSFDDEAPYINQTETGLDETLRMVWITEVYMQIDYDGDGIAEWRKIVKAGDVILENVECDGAPFAALIPIILPHRFFGLSIADLGFEPQRLQTQLIRSTLDNQFLQVNGRYFAVEGQVNLDDLLTSRPGGVVRIKQQGAVGRLDQAQGDTAGSMQMLEWVQDFTENATGWTRRSQGTGASGLQQQTATGMNLITNRDDMRLDLIARNFAEGGIAEMFKLILKLVCKYQDKADEVQISQNWVNINPREWKNQFGLTINVGLGTNNKEQQAQHLMGLLAIQKEGLQIGIATPENIYNCASLYAEALGQKNADKFFTDPKNVPPQPPQPNPDLMKIQAQAMLQDKQLQADVQKHQAELVQRQQEIQMQADARARELELEAQKQYQQAQLDMQERQHQAELNAELERQKLALKQYEIDRNNEVKVYVAELSAKTTLTKQQDAAADAAIDDENGENGY